MPKFQPHKIPYELRELDQWCCWQAGGNKKPLRIDGSPASSTDPKTWDRFEFCEACLDDPKLGGLGFIFSADDPYIGVDLDGCRNPESGEITDWAREIITELDSYTEISPSKTGVKIWVKASNPFGQQTGKNRKLKEFPNQFGKDPGIEVYHSGRYFTATGWIMRHSNPNIEERDEAVKKLVKRIFVEDVRPMAPPPSSTAGSLSVEERAARYVAKLEPSISGSGGHNACFHAACVLVIDFELSEDAAFRILKTNFNPRCDPPWSDRELQHKVRSATNTPGERGRLKNARPEHWDALPPVRYAERNQIIEHATPVSIVTLESAAHKYLDVITDGGAKLVETGLPDVDDALGGGMEDGEMVVIAARPSHGKSLVAMQMLDRASEIGVPTLMISEEMSALALGKRAIQYATEVPRGDWGGSVERLRHGVAQHFENRAPCYIAENAGTIQRVDQIVNDAVSKMGVKMVAVDYAQLINCPGKTPYERTSYVSRELKRIAKTYDVCMLTLCQMSRSVEGREKFTPKMQDIKESGQFEQDADVIMFLVWPHRLDSNKPREEYKIYIAKNRNRGVFNPVVTVKINAHRQRLELNREYAPHYGEFDSYNNEGKFE